MSKSSTTPLSPQEELNALLDLMCVTLTEDMPQQNSDYKLLSSFMARTPSLLSSQTWDEALNKKRLSRGATYFLADHWTQMPPECKTGDNACNLLRHLLMAKIVSSENALLCLTKIQDIASTVPVNDKKHDAVVRLMNEGVVVCLKEYSPVKATQENTKRFVEAFQSVLSFQKTFNIDHAQAWISEATSLLWPDLLKASLTSIEKSALSSSEKKELAVKMYEYTTSLALNKAKGSSRKDVVTHYGSLFERMAPLIPKGVKSVPIKWTSNCSNWPVVVGLLEKNLPKDVFVNSLPTPSCIEKAFIYDFSAREVDRSNVLFTIKLDTPEKKDAFGPHLREGLVLLTLGMTSPGHTFKNINQLSGVWKKALALDPVFFQTDVEEIPQIMWFNLPKHPSLPNGRPRSSQGAAKVQQDPRFADFLKLLPPKLKNTVLFINNQLHPDLPKARGSILPLPSSTRATASQLANTKPWVDAFCFRLLQDELVTQKTQKQSLPDQKRKM